MSFDTLRVTVRVPASTSNLGAGFDCVGVAVDRWLTLEAAFDRTLETPVTIERKGTLSHLDAAVLPEDDRITAAFAAACHSTGHTIPAGLRLHATSDIPVARGLGSSAAAAVAGAAAANALLHLGLDDRALAEVCAELEGHPDNVAAAVCGGATLALSTPSSTAALPPHAAHGAERSHRLTMTSLRVAPRITLVFAVPDFGVETHRARELLPAQVAHTTAVRAAALGAALVQGLANGDHDLLAAALEDVLHVPFREPLVPGYRAVTRAARAAGAFGATLSGSGSAIVALAPDPAGPSVAAAMCAAWRDAGVTANCWPSPARGAGRISVSLRSDHRTPPPPR